jgi:acetoin utilization deacetylase AcuC-like enzyme
MKKLPIIYSDEFLQHETGQFHPEKPERLTAIVQTLQQSKWKKRLAWQLPTPTTTRDVLPWIHKVHSQFHVDRVRHLAASGGGRLDLDTPVSPRSYDVALLAVSAWLDGIDTIWATNNPTFVLARPPGHHAEKDRGMGFCLFSNAAIAAHYALTLPQVDRVAILDWDVHHGNGTEAIIASNPKIIYCSLHQFPAYPGTGTENERGSYNNVLNLPLPPHSDFRQYRSCFVDRAIPFIAEFQPSLIIVSAGYDANFQDPLAEMSLQPEDYGKFTELLLPLSRRLLFGLEGGYHLESLARSVVETITTCFR